MEGDKGGGKPPPWRFLDRKFRNPKDRKTERSERQNRRRDLHATTSGSADYHFLDLLSIILDFFLYFERFFIIFDILGVFHFLLISCFNRGRAGIILFWEFQNSLTITGPSFNKPSLTGSQTAVKVPWMMGLRTRTYWRRERYSAQLSSAEPLTAVCEPFNDGL